MGHQPFEEWIFTGEPLSLEENQAFKEHMSACESCQLLFKAQIEIEGLLQGVAHAKPKSGFVSRWQTRLVKNLHQEQARKHRRQSWLFLVLALGMATIIFVPLAMHMINTYESPVHLLLGIVFQAIDFIVLMNMMQILITTLVKVCLAVIPPLYWLLMLVLFSFLTLLWLFSLRHLSITWRVPS